MEEGAGGNIWESGAPFGDSWALAMDLGLHISDMSGYLALPQFLHPPSMYSCLFSWVMRFDSQPHGKVHQEGAHPDPLPGLASQKQALQVAFPQSPGSLVPLCPREVGFFFRTPGLRAPRQCVQSCFHSFSPGALCTPGCCRV